MHTLKSLLFRNHEVFYRNSSHALPETHADMILCVTKSRAVPKQRSLPDQKVTLMKSPLPDLWREVPVTPYQLECEPPPPPSRWSHTKHKESINTDQLNNNSNKLALTSHSLLDTEVKCEDISFPESPVRWIRHWAESVLPTLDWLPLQLMVMRWEDVWLWNRINLSWTTPRPAYSNCQRHSGHVCEDLIEVAVMSDAPLSHQASSMLLTEPLHTRLLVLLPMESNLSDKIRPIICV